MSELLNKIIASLKKSGTELSSSELDRIVDALSGEDGATAPLTKDGKTKCVIMVRYWDNKNRSEGTHVRRVLSEEETIDELWGLLVKLSDDNKVVRDVNIIVSPV